MPNYNNNNKGGWTVPKNIKKLQSELLSQHNTNERKGIQLLQEAVYELTSFVFNELEAAAIHIRNQSAQIKQLQLRVKETETGHLVCPSPKSSKSPSPRHAEECEAVAMANKAATSTAKIREVTTAVVNNMSDLEERIDRIENIQRQHLEITKKTDTRNHTLSQEIAKAEDILRTLKEEQLKHSQATVMKKIDTFSRAYEIEEITEEEGMSVGATKVPPTNSLLSERIISEVASNRRKLEDVAQVTENLRHDLNALRRPTEARLQRLESVSAESDLRIQHCVQQTSSLRSRTHKAIQDLSSVLQIACPML